MARRSLGDYILAALERDPSLYDGLKAAFAEDGLDLDAWLERYRADRDRRRTMLDLDVPAVRGVDW